MTSAYAIPSEVEITSIGLYTANVDLGALLADGETYSDASATLLRIHPLPVLDVTLAAVVSTSVSVDIGVVTIDCTALTPGAIYALVVTGDIAADRQPSTVVNLRVVA